MPSSERTSFLQRNRDAIVLVVISALVGSIPGAIIGAVATYLLTRPSQP